MSNDVKGCDVTPRNFPNLQQFPGPQIGPGTTDWVIQKRSLNQLSDKELDIESKAIEEERERRFAINAFVAAVSLHHPETREKSINDDERCIYLKSILLTSADKTLIDYLMQVSQSIPIPDDEPKTQPDPESGHVFID